MNINDSFRDSVLVITGGTGSFGSTVLKHFLTTNIGEIRIISCDEKSGLDEAYITGSVS